MALHHISKPCSRRGFTLIEIVLVIGIISIVAAASITLSMPALAKFSCDQEMKTLLTVLERARHIAQLRKVGDIEVRITDTVYEVHSQKDGESPVLEDFFERQSSVPILPDDLIFFKEKSGESLAKRLKIQIGDEHLLCYEIVTVHNVGTITN